MTLPLKHSRSPQRWTPASSMQIYGMVSGWFIQESMDLTVSSLAMAFLFEKTLSSSEVDSLVVRSLIEKGVFHGFHSSLPLEVRNAMKRSRYEDVPMPGVSVIIRDIVTLPNRMLAVSERTPDSMCIDIPLPEALRQASNFRVGWPIGVWYSWNEATLVLHLSLSYEPPQVINLGLSVLFTIEKQLRTSDLVTNCSVITLPKVDMTPLINLAPDYLKAMLMAGLPITIMVQAEGEGQEVRGSLRIIPPGGAAQGGGPAIVAAAAAAAVADNVSTNDEVNPPTKRSLKLYIHDHIASRRMYSLDNVIKFAFSWDFGRCNLMVSMA